MTLQALHSDVLLHVPDGVYGIILGNIHTDHWRFRHLVGKDDCIISPICEFYLKNTIEVHHEAKFRIKVPHIMTFSKKITDNIRVKYQRNQASDFTDVRRGTTEEEVQSLNMAFQCTDTFVEIFTSHFCKFLVTSQSLNCCSRSIEMLVFSQFDETVDEPLASVSVFLCSLHYRDKDYRQVRFYNSKL